MADNTDASKPSGWKLFALSALFWLPTLSGVISRAIKQSNWFGDYQAVACAAEKHLLGQPMYDVNLACPDMHAAMFIYHPWVAQAFSYPLAELGQRGLMMVYAPLFVIAVLSLLWIMIGRGGTGARYRRAWFGAFMTGSAIYWGNVAVVLHAFIGVAATILRRWPIVLVFAIALAMIVKPLFATFAMVFLLARWPLWKRVGYAALTILLGLAPAAYLFWQGGPYAEQWSELVTYVIYEDRPGEAFLGWMSVLGATMDSTAVKVGYLGYGVVMTLAGLALAEGLELNDDDRALLGLSLGILVNPRLMSQDYWLLGPGLIAMATVLSARAPGAGKWVMRALLWLCVLVLVGNLADLADYTGRIVTFGLALTVIAAALWTVTSGHTKLATVWSALLVPAPGATPQR
jgi:hypothetical protein